MKILSSLLFILLVMISSGYHAYYVWKKKDFKTFKVVIGIVSLAVLSGILLIFGIQIPSIAELFNSLNQIVK